MKTTSIKNKSNIKAIHYACFKLGEKATESGKKNKNIFINVIGDKFAMSIGWGKLMISFCKRFSSHLYKQQNKLLLIKWFLTHFMAKYLETSGFQIYFRNYRERQKPWSGLKIFLTNMSAKCWCSWLFHNRARFLLVNLNWFFQCTWEVSSFNVFQLKLILRNTSQWLLPVDLHGNQLKQ